MAEITIKNLKQRHIEAFLAARRDIKNKRAGLDPESFAASLASFAVQLSSKKLTTEQYDTALAQFVNGMNGVYERRQEITQAEQDGVNVRAAARCGWFDELDADDVGDLEAWRVDQLSTEIVDLFNEAVTVPEN